MGVYRSRPLVAVVDVSLSDDPVLNIDLDAVAHSATKEFTTLFSISPPAGARPISILYRSQPPLTDSTSDPTRYQIYLSVKNRFYDQLVFQLGHELCHIFADPRRTNWFVESCCEMASVVLLRRMSKLWGQNPPFANWRSYAPKFQEYAQNRIREAHESVFKSNCPQDEARLCAWLADAKHSFAKEPCDRQRNVIVAEMLCPLFEESAESWDALCLLGQASTSPPVSRTDLNLNSDFRFDRWLQAVPEYLKGLVVRIGKMFED